MVGKSVYRFFFGFFCSFFIAVPLDIATSIKTLHTGKGCLMIAAAGHVNELLIARMIGVAPLSLLFGARPGQDPRQAVVAFVARHLVDLSVGERKPRPDLTGCADPLSQGRQLAA